MRKLYLSEIITALFFLGVVILSPAKISACQCNIKLACEEFSLAEAVFTGKLEKIEEDTGSIRGEVTAHFAVEKTFKGKTEKIQSMQLVRSDCNDLELTVGETYFVYKHSSSAFYSCTRTRLLSLSSEDLKYAESLSETNPIYSIGGRLDNYESSGFPKEAVKNAKVWIGIGEKKISLKIDKDGNFEYTAREKGKYRVKIVLPIETEVWMSSWSRMIFYEEGSGFKITRTKNQTTIEYDLDFEPNSCSFREISKHFF